MVYSLVNNFYSVQVSETLVSCKEHDTFSLSKISTDFWIIQIKETKSVQYLTAGSISNGSIFSLILHAETIAHNKGQNHSDNNNSYGRIYNIYHFQALILSTVCLDFIMMLDTSFTCIILNNVDNIYHLDSNSHLNSAGCCQDNLSQMCRLVDNNWYSHGEQRCLHTSQLKKPHDILNISAISLSMLENPFLSNKHCAALLV